MLAIINGKLLTITNGVIENGTILVENGKITAVGADVQVPAGADVIDAAGTWPPTASPPPVPVPTRTTTSGSARSLLPSISGIPSIPAPGASV